MDQLQELSMRAWPADFEHAAPVQAVSKLQQLKQLLLPCCCARQGDWQLLASMGRLNRLQLKHLEIRASGPHVRQPSSSITRMSGSFTRMSGSSITRMSGSFTRMSGSSITRMSGSSITRMSGSFTRMSGSFTKASRPCAGFSILHYPANPAKSSTACSRR
jgi:hypothetical protein